MSPVQTVTYVSGSDSEKNGGGNATGSEPSLSSKLLYLLKNPPASNAILCKRVRRRTHAAKKSSRRWPAQAHRLMPQIDPGFVQ